MIVAGIGLKPSASEVSRFNAWFDSKCAVSGIEKTLAADLKLCINEVLANLISYGFKDTPDPSTMVEIGLEPGRASAIVTDNGQPFDLREWQISESRNLMTDEPGGFGIALIRERATHVDCTRNGAWNRLEIICEGATP